MTHLVRRRDWGVIDLDTGEGRVFVQQRWRYEWHTRAGVAAWSYRERRRFHDGIDRQVWRTWSDAIHISVAGDHELARNHPRLRLTFDVRWVLARGDWTVHVTKLPPGAESPRSFVDFPARSVHLDSLDLVPHGVGNDAGARRDGFLTVPHEFGHTFPEGAGGASPVGDEYGAASGHIADADSLMNIGRQIRARHIRVITEELAAMLPECRFAAA